MVVVEAWTDSNQSCQGGPSPAVIIEHQTKEKINKKSIKTNERHRQTNRIF